MFLDVLVWFFCQVFLVDFQVWLLLVWISSQDHKFWVGDLDLQREFDFCGEEKSTTMVLLSCPKHGDRRSRKIARKATSSNRSSKGGSDFWHNGGVISICGFLLQPCGYCTLYSGPYCRFTFKARFRKAIGSGSDASGNLWSG